MDILGKGLNTLRKVDNAIDTAGTAVKVAGVVAAAAAGIASAYILYKRVEAVGRSS